MHKSIGSHRPLSIACLILSLAACSSDPPAPPLSGEQMLRESQNMAQLSSRWQQGKQMTERGQSLQREGQARIDQGSRMIEEGNRIMQESEDGYKNIKQ
ncbi:MAG: hypothetical protein ACU837_05290 [Gammaproteobacteria bacterium]